ncbi:hypothetical protein BRC81_08285 [Halobacteriales archaeon QS_1_68_20]|nr:MAG: hypothetical protein BRC81_08285 [Halobacteriales archaeon QS_1_68_20]
MTTIQNVLVPTDGSEGSRATLSYAADHDVDLVVLGSHGLSGFERYLLGSVAEKVICLADPRC